MWIYLLLLIGIPAIIGAAYLGLVAYGAKHDTEDAPRQDMFVCDKHGLFPKKYAMQLTGVTEEPILQCPMCMEDKFKQAKEHGHIKR